MTRVVLVLAAGLTLGGIAHADDAVPAKGAAQGSAAASGSAAPAGSGAEATPTAKPESPAPGAVPPGDGEAAKRLLRALVTSEPPAAGSSAGDPQFTPDERKAFDASMRGFAEDLAKQLGDFGKKLADDVRREMEKKSQDPETKAAVERVQKVVDEARKKAEADLAKRQGAGESTATGKGDRDTKGQGETPAPASAAPAAERKDATAPAASPTGDGAKPAP